MWPYFGRKMKVLKYYPKPKYDRIIEPFAGTASYSLKYWQSEITLVDKYKVIIELWKYLQAASPKDILSLPKIKLGDDIRTYNISDIERKFMGFYINYGVTSPRNVVTKLAYGNNGQYWESKKKRVAADLYKIKHWKIIQDDYFIIKNETATWFIDPPYQKTKSKYIHNDIDYKYLAKWCKYRKGQIIVCESNDADWLPFTLLTNKLMTGQIHKKQEELIWVKENN